jgi:transposase-like protein
MGSGGEGAEFWMCMLVDLKNRGVTDVFFLVCDGLKGLPEVVVKVWPRTIVQTCVIHLIRDTFRLVSQRDWDALKRDVKLIYTALGPDAALAAFGELEDKWGRKYAAVIRLWRNAWTEFVPFLDYDLETRKMICSTNAIESLNARYRRAIRAQGHFPTEQAGWIQLASATPGGLLSGLESSCSSASAGLRQPRRLRGRLLSSAATNSR